MKKLGTFILIFILFSNKTPLNQLFKVPLLISHFLEHQEIDGKVGFVDFLSMHYWGDDLNDNDQDRDMQLPFKIADVNGSLQIIIPPATATIEYQSAPYLNLFEHIFQDPNISDPALSALFRPPKA